MSSEKSIDAKPMWKSRTQKSPKKSSLGETPYPYTQYWFRFLFHFT